MTSKNDRIITPHPHQKRKKEKEHTDLFFLSGTLHLCSSIGLVPSTIAASLEELLLIPALAFKKIRGSHKKVFFSTMLVFWWVLVLRLMKRGRKLFRTGGWLYTFWLKSNQLNEKC